MLTLTATLAVHFVWDKHFYRSSNVDIVRSEDVG
jgi:hypothetical protein